MARLPLMKHNTQLDPEKAGAAQFSYAVGDYDFYLEVGGKLAGVFLQMEGGDMEITVIGHDVTFETGDSTTLLIPGTITFKEIKLTRAIVADELSLYNWLNEVVNGDIIQARRNGSIWMYGPGRDDNGDAARVVHAQWNFYNAWPKSITGMSYNTTRGSRSAKVSLTIVPEAIERVY